MAKTTAERKRYYTCPGRKTLPTYQEEITKAGRKGLVKTGETNVYARIQEDHEQTKIENILHSLAMGDLSVLKQADATYMDTTNMPKTLMEYQNLGLKAKQEFEKMPVEVKELFHNSAEEYVSLMGTDAFLEKMAPYNKKIEEIKKAGSVKKYEEKVKAQAKFEEDVAKEKGVTANE